MLKPFVVRLMGGLLPACLLLPGCATLISTPYQTIRVTGLPAGSTVYVNDKVAKTKPLPGNPAAVGVRVSRKKNAEIKVKHEGYKAFSTLLKPTKTNPVTYLNYAAGLASIPFWLSESAPTGSLGFKTITYNWGPIITGLVLTTITPFVDIATGAARRFPVSEVNAQLTRQPSAAAGSASLQAGPVTVHLKGGEQVGNLYLNGEVSELLYMGKSLSLEADELRNGINQSLRELGYAVPATEGRSVFGSAASTRYTVQAEVRELKYDIRQTTSLNPAAARAYGAGYGGVRLVPLDSRYETSCAVDVTWRLLNQGRQPVAEAKTNGRSVRFEQGGGAAFADAFENALYAFLDRPEVAAALTAKDPAPALPATSAPAPGAALAPIALHRPRPAKAEAGNPLAIAARNVATVATADGHGSGCLVSPDGYLVTNAHVVGEASTVKVQLADGIETTGRVVRVNADMDLALVKIDVDGLMGFRLPPAAAAEVGADVYAIGTPADKELGQSITKGIISGRRKIEGRAYLQTDVSISGGNSGGALVTRTGELLGIVNAKLVGQRVEGIGFAIPAELVSEALQLQFVD